MVENFVRKMCYNSAACRLQVSEGKFSRNKPAFIRIVINKFTG